MKEKPFRNLLSTRVFKFLFILFLISLAIFHGLFATASASVNSPFQAAAALIAALTYGYSAYRILVGLHIAKIVFLGTLPFWLIHIPITVMDKNESRLFITASAIAPAVSGVWWFVGKDKSKD